MFRTNPLKKSDGYKPGHRKMLAPGTTKVYGTWIPRSLKHAPEGVDRIVSFGQRITWKSIHDMFMEDFFNMPKEIAVDIFKEDISKYQGSDFDAKHIEDLWELGYLPLRVKALPEGISTLPGIVHQTFVNTVDGMEWLTLYIETIISNHSWKPSTSASISRAYRINTENAFDRTDRDNKKYISTSNHDFSSRGLNGDYDQLSVALGHAIFSEGSDTIIAIDAARYYYNMGMKYMPINSVNASEHSVTCTGIFYYKYLLEKGLLNKEIEEYYSFDEECEGSIDNPDILAIAEWLNLRRWLGLFSNCVLSVVSDTFDLWKLIKYILTRLRKEIKDSGCTLVVRPDSGDPVEIICGYTYKDFANITDAEIYYRKTGVNNKTYFKVDGQLYKVIQHSGDEFKYETENSAQSKGVIELLGEIFGYTFNSQGFKCISSSGVGAIYGDSITLSRQKEIYKRLEDKGYSCNIALGIGSYTYQYVTRDTLGYAAKASWFEAIINGERIGFDIYKDPITDDGTKKSLKGFQAVLEDEFGEYYNKSECTVDEENTGILELIYENGIFYNEVSYEVVRERARQDLMKFNKIDIQ